MSDATEPTALTTIEPNALVATFHAPGGVDALLERMKRDARTRAADLDISTPRGRSEIASLARTVIARAKTTWIAKGKELTEGWRNQTKAVNNECKKIETELDALRDEIRAPLTAWENAEKNRLAGHEAAIAAIEALAQVGGMMSNQIADRLASVPDVDARVWQEFRSRAERVTTATTNALNVALTDARQAEAEAAERAARAAQEAEERRLEAERLQREREERIAAEAAEAEKKRLEDERRAANVAHRKRINNEALAALVEHAGLSDAAAKSAIEAIACGQVPHLAIAY